MLLLLFLRPNHHPPSSQSTCTNGNGKFDTTTNKCLCSLSTLGSKPKPSYWGESCELKICPGYLWSTDDTFSSKEVTQWSFCSGHGSCNGTTSLCACSAGRTGEDCSTPVSLVKVDVVENELRERAVKRAKYLMEMKPTNSSVFFFFEFCVLFFCLFCVLCFCLVRWGGF